MADVAIVLASIPTRRASHIVIVIRSDQHLGSATRERPKSSMNPGKWQFHRIDTLTPKAPIGITPPRPMEPMVFCRTPATGSGGSPRQRAHRISRSTGRRRGPDGIVAVRTEDVWFSEPSLRIGPHHAQRVAVTEFSNVLPRCRPLSWCVRDANSGSAIPKPPRRPDHVTVIPDEYKSRRRIASHPPPGVGPGPPLGGPPPRIPMPLGFRRIPRPKRLGRQSDAQAASPTGR